MIAAYRRLLPYARRYRVALGTGGFLAAIQVLIALAQPFPVALLVDRVLVGDAESLPITPGEAVAAAIVALMAITGLSALVEYWSTRLLSSSGLRVAADVRVDVFGHLQRLSLRFHASQRVGDLTSRVTADVDKMQELIVASLATVLPNLLLVIGTATVMFVLDPLFALIALGASPIMGYVAYRSTTSQTLAARQARKADGQVAAATTEGLGAMHLVQAFSLERPMRRRMQSLTRASLGRGLEAVRLQARLSPSMDMVSSLSTAIVLGYGSWRVLQAQLSLAVLLVFLGYVANLWKPLKALSRMSIVLSRGVAASERVLDVLHRDPEVDDLPGAHPAPPLQGSVQFSRVSFSYGREPVLEEFDLFVAAGESVAIVGPTGAGKSTVAGLIPRLMDPQSGTVRVDGYDVRDLTLRSLREQVSLVLQDCVLLDGSLYDNIACGRRGAREADVLRAARLALVDEFADRLPDGLDTPVGERGVALSGGQRQRVAIARAVLRDAPILVLDEPTSALDAAAEEMIVASLDALPRGRTRIIIAHRLSTVRDVDRVAFMDRGRVVEHGAPADLLAHGGRYAHLVHAQGLGSGYLPGA